MNQMTLEVSLRRSRNSAAWLAIGNYGNFGMSFLIFLVLARLLPPVEFGIVAIAGLFLDIFLIIARGGLADAVVRRHDLDEEYADTAFLVSAAAGLVCFLAFLALSHPIASAFNIPQLGDVLTALSSVFVISGLGAIHEGRLQRIFGFKSMAVRGIVANLVSGAAALWLASAGFGVWSLVAQRLLSALTTVVVTWIAFPWIPRFRLNAAYAKDQITFGSKIFCSTLLLTMTTRSFELIAAFFLGPVAAGYLRLCWRCIDVANQIAIFPLSSVALPTYARLQPDAGAVEKAYLHFVGLAATFSLPCFFGMAAMAPMLVPLLFGEQWAPAADPLQILCLVGPTMISNIFMWPVLYSADRAGDAVKFNLLQLILSVALSLATVRWGLNCLAAAHLVTDLLLWPFQHWFLRERAHISIRDTLVTLATPSLAAAAFAVIVAAIYPLVQDYRPLFTLLVSGGVGIVIYFPIMAVMFPNSGKTVLSSISSLKRLWQGRKH